MRTPEPVAYLEERHGGLLGLSFFISVQCPYAHRLYKADGAYCFSIVDINRMRFGPVSMAAGCNSFRRLWGPKAFFRLLAQEYARHRGLDPAACERLVLACRRKFWQHYLRHHKMEFEVDV